jgi:hypothetical protein
MRCTVTSSPDGNEVDLNDTLTGRHIRFTRLPGDTPASLASVEVFGSRGGSLGTISASTAEIAVLAEALTRWQR